MRRNGKISNDNGGLETCRVSSGVEPYVGFFCYFFCSSNDYLQVHYEWCWQHTNGHQHPTLATTSGRQLREFTTTRGQGAATTGGARDVAVMRLEPWFFLTPVYNKYIMITWLATLCNSSSWIVNLCTVTARIFSSIHSSYMTFG